MNQNNTKVAETKVVDTLITGGIVWVNDGTGLAFNPGSIAIGGHLILDVGPSATVDQKYAARQVIHASNRMVIPGLIDSHTHVAMWMMKGLFDGGDDSLYRYVWPLESALTPEDIYDLAMVGIVETVKCGATSLADHYFFMEEIAHAFVEVGARGWLGHTIMDYWGPFKGKSQFREGIRFAEAWQGKTPTIVPTLAPHAPDTVSEATLKEIVEVSHDKGLRVHLHVAQTENETFVIRDRAGSSVVAYLEHIGALGPFITAAHCIHVSPEDIERLRDYQVHVVYCPTTHALLGKSARAGYMYKQGVKVGLGTDCSAFNDDMDMFEEMRTALVSQNLIESTPRSFTDQTLFSMATTVNALGLGAGSRLGIISKGYLADLVILRTGCARMNPPKYIANVVRCCSQAQVDKVIIDGQIVVDDGRIITVDEDEVVSRANLAANRVLERAGLGSGFGLS